MLGRRVFIFCVRSDLVACASVLSAMRESLELGQAMETIPLVAFLAEPEVVNRRLAAHFRGDRGPDNTKRQAAHGGFRRNK